METTNHETYVSLEVAKLLKKAGFDWEVKFFYRDGILKSVLPDELFNGDFEDIEYYYKHIGIPHQSLNYNDGSSKFLEEYSAPTLAVAQRWLREVKLISVEINVVRWFNRYQTNECTIFWRYIILSIDTSSQEAFHRIVDIDNGLEFNTSEEASEAGIKKALELILGKGK